MFDAISITAPMVLCAPPTDAMSRWVMPFCSVTTNPSPARIGSTIWVNYLVSYALTTRKMRSNLPLISAT